MHDPWSREYIYSYCVSLASTFVLRGAALKLLSGSQVGEEEAVFGYFVPADQGGGQK